jgi:hypothetical protein
MSLIEELARVRIAEARQAADQVVRQSQLRSARGKARPLGSLVLRIVASAKSVAAGSADRLRRLRSLRDGQSTAV